MSLREMSMEDWRLLGRFVPWQSMVNSCERRLETSSAVTTLIVNRSAGTNDLVSLHLLALLSLHPMTLSSGLRRVQSMVSGFFFLVLILIRIINNPLMERTLIVSWCPPLDDYTSFRSVSYLLALGQLLFSRSSFIHSSSNPYAHVPFILGSSLFNRQRA